MGERSCLRALGQYAGPAIHDLLGDTPDRHADDWNTAAMCGGNYARLAAFDVRCDNRVVVLDQFRYLAIVDPAIYDGSAHLRQPRALTAQVTRAGNSELDVHPFAAQQLQRIEEKGKAFVFQDTAKEEQPEARVRISHSPPYRVAIGEIGKKQAYDPFGRCQSASNQLFGNTLAERDNKIRSKRFSAQPQARKPSRISRMPRGVMDHRYERNATATKAGSKERCPHVRQ